MQALNSRTISTRRLFAFFSIMVLGMVKEDLAYEGPNPLWKVPAFLQTGYQSYGSVPERMPGKVSAFGGGREVVHKIVIDKKRVMVAYSNRLCVLNSLTGDSEKEIVCDAMNVSPSGNSLGVLRTNDNGTYTLLSIARDYSASETGTVTGDFHATLLNVCSRSQHTYVSFTRTHDLSDGPANGMEDLVYGRIGSATGSFESLWSSWLRISGRCVLSDQDRFCIADPERGILIFNGGTGTPEIIPLHGRPVALVPFRGGKICEISLSGSVTQIKQIAKIERQLKDINFHDGKMAADAGKEIDKLISRLRGAVFVLSTNGEVIWECKLSEQALLPCCPAVCPDGTVLVPARKAVIAVRNGQVIWKKTLKVPSQECQISAMENGVLIASGKNLYVIDKKNGKEMWSIGLESEVTTRPVSDENGNVYIGTVNGAFKALKGP